MPNIKQGNQLSQDDFEKEAYEMLKKYKDDFEHIDEIQAKIKSFYAQYMKIKQL